MYLNKGSKRPHTCAIPVTLTDDNYVDLEKECSDIIVVDKKQKNLLSSCFVCKLVWRCRVLSFKLKYNKALYLSLEMVVSGAFEI